MKQLVVISKTVIGEQETNSVDARELHTFLESKQDFSTWVKSKVVENVFFKENVDFILLHNIMEQTCNTKARGGHNRKDYALTIDTAKKVAMSEQTARGDEVRNYFLECEKRLEQVKSIYDTKHVPNQIKDVVEIQLLTTKYLSEMLRYSEVSTLGIVHKINKSHGIPTDYLPEYVSNQKPVFALTDLLKQHGINISPQNFNKLLEIDGFIERKERKSTRTKSGIKTFPVLTEKGLRYGKNEVCPANPKQIQPNYFEDTFPELLNLVYNKVDAAA